MAMKISGNSNSARLSLYMPDDAILTDSTQRLCIFDDSIYRDFPDTTRMRVRMKGSDSLAHAHTLSMLS